MNRLEELDKIERTIAISGILSKQEMRILKNIFDKHKKRLIASKQNQSQNKTSI